MVILVFPLMIQGERGLKSGSAAYIEEYKALKRFWDVSPFIEQLLGEEIQRFLDIS